MGAHLSGASLRVVVPDVRCEPFILQRKLHVYEFPDDCGSVSWGVVFTPSLLRLCPSLSTCLGVILFSFVEVKELLWLFSGLSQRNLFHM